ncbi:protein phosphatase 2C domain-containing protein [Propionimicrobium sp. PCR01-08-3]|nr:protein phosphatase 2C domain-containing protein [Propionimicrobium sp. PCR01-08-3]WIY84283.1 protein phosphatase 2C domain-containing protein [Propionimicrobium sp. PCR01-08-3]
MAFSLKISAHSEIGLVRNNNQDSAYISPHLIVVADGMGGAAAGDLASSVAIRELRRTDKQNLSDQRHDERAPQTARGDEEPSDGDAPLTGDAPLAADAPIAATAPLAGDDMLEALSGALSKANDAISDLVNWDHSLEGMGTTVCGAMFSGTQYGIGHIGDSRGYLLRDGQLTRLTHDHSWVQSLLDAGRITPEEAATHPHRSLLLKVLNGQPAHTPDFTLVDAKLGDRVLFCSDGLCGMVDDEVIHTLLAADKPLDDIVKSLTSAAYQGGGLDNITMIVADVVDYDEALQQVPPQVIGAAAAMKIPDTDFSDPAGLEELVEQTARVPRQRVPLAGTPLDDDLPEGVIDPDRYEAIRYTPHMPGRKRRWIGWALTIILVLALVSGGAFAGRAYLDSQYFIGPEDEQAAIYQGLPEDVFGHSLADLVKPSEIQVSDLPPYYEAKVRNKELRFDAVDQAQGTLDKLGEMAERCKAEREASGEPSTPQAPDPTSSENPEGSPSSGPEDTASAEDSPSADDTATSIPSDRPDLEACG